MSDRPLRSTPSQCACLLETVFASIAFGVYAFVVWLAGSFNFSPDAPFKWKIAFQFGSLFFLPVATVVAAVVLLWLRNRWGFYLTFIANAAGAYLVCLWFANDLKARLRGPNHLPLVTELGLASLIAIIIAPIVLLVLPTSRRDFL
jgi:hypothetical protein